MTDSPSRSSTSRSGSEVSTPTTGRGSASLLTRVLSTPNLAPQIQALPAVVFAKLVGHIGLEDAGELVALATTAQITEVLDEEIWRRAQPGRNEIFDPSRFRVWLSVLLEGGDAQVAEKLRELPEDLVTLGFHRQMLVLRADDLIELGEDVAAGIESTLSSCLVEEFDAYLLVARVDEGWDDVFAAILALDRAEREFLVRVLERCVQTSGAEIEASGGLEQALTLAESLEEDVAGEREDRRAEAGYVAPADAAAFLRLARDRAETPARDAVTKAYFRRRAQPSETTAEMPPELAISATSRTSDLLELLLEAEVVGRDAAPPLLLEGPQGDAARQEPLLIAAMRRLAEQGDARLSACAEEIAYLANVMVAGCSFEERRFAQGEAAEAVIATCSLGLDLEASGEGDAVEAAAEVLRQRGADDLFRRAWSHLSSEVVRAAAEAAAQLLDFVAAKEIGAEQRALRQARTRLQRAAAAGAPWTAFAAVDTLLGHVDDDVVATLRGLIDECPSLRGRLASGSAPRFLAEVADVDAVGVFLRHTLQR